EEAAELRLDLPVEAGGDGALGDGERLRVGREGTWAAAKHIARELIEQDEQRERTVDVLFPGGKAAGRRDFMRRQEAIADFGVEGATLGKPLVWAGAAPESDDIRRRAGDTHHSCRFSSSVTGGELLVAQQATQNLADIGLGQLGAEFDLPRHLVAG